MSKWREIANVMRAAAWVVATGAGLMMGGAAYAEAPADAQYVGNAQCKVCHNKQSTGAQWTVWKSVPHAKALEPLKTDEANKIAADKGLSVPAAEAPECLKCHVTAYDVDKKAAPEAIVMADGVQCESCHGPASAHIAVAKKVMFQKDEAAKAELPKTIIRGDAETCKKCHNPESPTWNPEKYTLEDGTKAGFDYKQAYKKIAHPNPEKAAGASPSN